jgi:putative membrane protein
MTDGAEPDPRVFFAAERTFLAWIRTGLALMGFGFVVARFGLFLNEIAALRGDQPSPAGFSHWLGVALLGCGVVLTAGAAASHVATVRRLNRGEPYIGRPTWLGLSTAAVLILVGVLATAYLILSG